MIGKEDCTVDSLKRLVVAAVVIHDPQHDIKPVPWPTARAANGADHRHERPQWTDIMR